MGSSASAPEGCVVGRAGVDQAFRPQARDIVAEAMRIASEICIRTRKSPSRSCRHPHHSEDGSSPAGQGNIERALSDLDEGRK